jgi:hypothetical protein
VAKGTTYVARLSSALSSLATRCRKRAKAARWQGCRCGGQVCRGADGRGSIVRGAPDGDRVRNGVDDRRVHGETIASVQPTSRSDNAVYGN